MCFYKFAQWDGNTYYRCGLECAGEATLLPFDYNRSAKNRYNNRAVRVYRSSGANVGCMDPGDNIANFVVSPPPSYFRVFGTGSSCN